MKVIDRRLTRAEELAEKDRDDKSVVLLFSPLDNSDAARSRFQTQVEAAKAQGRQVVIIEFVAPAHEAV